MAATLPTTFDWFELGEEHGLSEGANERGPWARKPYLVPWIHRWDFVRALRGNSSTTGPTGPWIRAIPYQYPDEISMYVLDVTIEPIGRIDPVPAIPYTPIRYGWSKLTVGFGIPEWSYQASDDPLFLNSLSDDPGENQALQWATQKLSYGREVYPVPTGGLSFPDGTHVASRLAKQVAVVTMDVTWHRFPRLPSTAIMDLTGKVNDLTFLRGPHGTVYFGGCETEPTERPVDGVLTNRVHMTFKYRPIPWNRFLRPDTLVWDTVRDAAGNLVYENADFAPILDFFRAPAS